MSITVGRLTKITRIRGVDVYVHWSVLVIAAIILLGAVRRPLMSIIGLASYLSVLLIHECGHMIAARRRNSAVYSIELYPLWAKTCFQVPWSRLDHCAIAWGGVIAQVVIALPLVAWLLLFGYTRFEPVNEVLALLGGFSLAMAAFNLLPFPPLDGATAWGLFPALLQRAKSRRKEPPEWKRFR